MITRATDSWNLRRAAELYQIDQWGEGYFGVNSQGHVTVHPRKDPAQEIDLEELVEGIRKRGIELPVLIRFTDILKTRVHEMSRAFRDAIEEYGYRGEYLGVYPVKVNQHRQVVEEFLDTGRELDCGLECGSKPELVATLAMTHGSDAPIICNGFKDDEHLEMVVFAQKMGRAVIPVIEKYSELPRLLRCAARLGVRPMFGIRVKLSTPGAGRWKLSGGDRSKFGLTITELLSSLELLRKEQLEDCFQLLHFHLGSQITNIHNVKNAISEAARIYVELKRSCPGLTQLDVGGGLGVDYDGSQTNFESSMNYTLQEYARDVVFRVQTVCDEAGVPHPTIITESGRATVAFHSVLVFETLGVSSFSSARMPTDLPSDLPMPLADLVEISLNTTEKNLLESYHDAVQAYGELLESFKLGFLTLEQRSLAEQLYYVTAQKILRIVRTLDHVPEELADIETQLSDTYFCNFSVFNSLPDAWAVHQLFPIVPIHRLDEEPSRRGILADVTCDSDGKVDRFIDLRDIKRALELHPYDGRPYFLGVFLVGAYQEILGDLHNLFGDTNNVHVTLDENDSVQIDTVIKGDTVREVLSYVEYNSSELLAWIRRDVERALRRGRITIDESASFLRSYEATLGAYTYPTSVARSDEEPPAQADDDREARPVKTIRPSLEAR